MVHRFGEEIRTSGDSLWKRGFGRLGGGVVDNRPRPFIGALRGVVGTWPGR
jgi:hypothetical protein